MKDILNSIIIGIKKGLNIDTLPIKVRNFIDKPIVRLLRVIGGICLLMVLYNSYNAFYLPLNYFILVMGVGHAFFFVIITFIKSFYSLHKIIFKKEEFEVRKSPNKKI